ncbi:Lipase, class 3, partial [Cynara cardunculus var. scolymus]
EKEDDGFKDTKRPICITFGCPLVGNQDLRKAISERPQWKSRFLNVVAQTDPVARFYSSNSLYKPFGTSLFCTESGGHMVFEDQESVPAALDAMASSITENTEIDYGNHLKSIRRKVLYRGVSKLGEFGLDSLRAGITLQFSEVGHVLDDNCNDLIGRMEEEQRLAKRKSNLRYDRTKSKKLNKAKTSMVCMELYMKNERSKGGYYDRFKTPVKSKSEIESYQEIVKNKRILDQYWKETVAENNLMPQNKGAKLRNCLLYGGNTYRKIVEPLDIAEHYKLNGEYYKNGEKHYLEIRSQHYQLLEKWLNEDKKGLNPSERSNKAASLNDDSCFWAHVEEASVLLSELKNGGSTDVRGQKLEQFETYVMTQGKLICF